MGYFDSVSALQIHYLRRVSSPCLADPSQFPCPLLPFFSCGNYLVQEHHKLLEYSTAFQICKQGALWGLCWRPVQKK